MPKNKRVLLFIALAIAAIIIVASLIAYNMGQKGKTDTITIQSSSLATQTSSSQDALVIPETSYSSTSASGVSTSETVSQAFSPQPPELAVPELTPTLPSSGQTLVSQASTSN